MILTGPVPDLSHLPSPASNLSNIVISSEAVICYIEKLPTGKSLGYDGISNEILKALETFYLLSSPTYLQ